MIEETPKRATHEDVERWTDALDAVYAIMPPGERRDAAREHLRRAREAAHDAVERG